MKKEKKFSQIKFRSSITSQRKGVSPIISTVLLISMVVVIALIIFLWFRNINKEAITKFDGTNVELICGDVKFDSSYSSGTLSVFNSGNVPIYSMKLKISKSGSYETTDLHDVQDSNWPDKGLNPGAAVSSGPMGSLIDGSEKAFLIPVLVGMTESGEQKLFTCQEQYEQQLAI